MYHSRLLILIWIQFPPLPRKAGKLRSFIKLLEKEDESKYRSRLLILVWILFPPLPPSRAKFWRFIKLLEKEDYSLYLCLTLNPCLNSVSSPLILREAQKLWRIIRQRRRFVVPFPDLSVFSPPPARSAEALTFHLIIRERRRCPVLDSFSLFLPTSSYFFSSLSLSSFFFWPAFFFGGRLPPPPPTGYAPASPTAVEKGLQHVTIFLINFFW